MLARTERAGVGAGCAGGREQSHGPLPASSSAAFSPGARGLLPRDRGLGALPGGRLPPPPRFAGELALLARRGARRSSWEGGSDRRLLRAASGGREPSWRSCHLERRRRAGERVLGKGPGGGARGARRAGPERGSRAWRGPRAGVWSARWGSVCGRGRVAPGEEEQRPPLLTSKSPEFRAVLTGRSRERAWYPLWSPLPPTPTTPQEAESGEGGGQNPPTGARTHCRSKVVFSFPSPPTGSIPLQETCLSKGMGVWTPPRYDSDFS